MGADPFPLPKGPPIHSHWLRPWEQRGRTLRREGLSQQLGGPLQTQIPTVIQKAFLLCLSSVLESNAETNNATSDNCRATKAKVMIYRVAENTEYKLCGRLDYHHLKCALEGRTEYTKVLSVAAFWVTFLSFLGVYVFWL